MSRGRPPRAHAPPQPPVEPEAPTDPDSEDGADPDADEEQGDEQPDPETPQPKHKVSPLDEPAGSPGSTGPVRFGPGFGIKPPGEGHNYIGGIGMGLPGVSPPPPRAPDPPRQPYMQEAEQIESEIQSQSDGALARDFLGQHPGDMRVDVEVWQVDGLQAVPRGRIENMMLSTARVPSRYIPYGGFGGNGQWQLEFYSTMTGKFLRRIKVTLPGEEPPADYRVENAVADEQAIKALIKLLNGGGGSVQGMPLGAYQDEKAWLRQEIAELKKQREDDRREMDRRDRDAERQRWEDRIRQLEGGGGGQNQTLATIQAIGALYAPLVNGRGGDDRLVDIVLQMNGPGMMQAQAAMYNQILEAATKFSGDGESGGLKGMIGGALKDGIKGYMENMGKRQAAHDEWMRKREEKKEQATKAQPKAEVPRADAPAAPGNGGGSTDKALFARMIRDVREAMQRVGSASVPQAEKPTVQDVANKFVLCFRTSIELGLHKADPTIDEMTSDILRNPELFIAKWCAAYGPTAEFGAQVAALFRKMTDMPPLAPPAPAPAAPAPQPTPAEGPAESVGPVETSTIRLSPSSSTAEAPAAAGGSPPGPSATAVEPSVQAQAQHAEVGQVAEGQGAVHVVDGRPAAPAGKGVEERDPEPEGGEPPKEDARGLVDAEHPAAQVEQPAVPQAPRVVVEPNPS